MAHYGNGFLQEQLTCDDAGSPWSDVAQREMEKQVEQAVKDWRRALNRHIGSVSRWMIHNHRLFCSHTDGHASISWDKGIAEAVLSQTLAQAGSAAAHFVGRGVAPAPSAPRWAAG